MIMMLPVPVLRAIPAHKGSWQLPSMGPWSCPYFPTGMPSVLPVLAQKQRRPGPRALRLLSSVVASFSSWLRLRV